MPFLLSQLMEASRWIGALCVLMLHASNVFVNLGDIMTAPHAAPVYVWWFFNVFSFGHQAVVGFFVLSGWLVGGAVLAKIKKRQDFLQDYFIHRFSRIYMVLAPAVLVTLVADFVGSRVAPGIALYQSYGERTTLFLFFTTLANFQEILFPAFGTNSPLWSVACEFWNYITFPLLFLPFARNYPAWLRYGGFLAGVVIVGVLATPDSWFRIGYVIWVISAFAANVKRAPIKSRWLTLIAYAALVILIRFFVRGPYLAAHPWLADAADIVAAAMFLLVLLAFRDGPQEGFAALRPKYHRTLANFSFSLYVVHTPLLLMLAAIVVRFTSEAWLRQPATLAHYLLTLGAMAIAIGFGYVFSRFTEAHTGAARRVLRSWIERRAPAVVAEDQRDAERAG